MNNNRAQIYSRLSCFPHPAPSSSSSSCPSPSPAPAASTPPLLSPVSTHPNPRDHNLSLLKLQAAQRQHALKLRNFPPLSPQESSTLSFSDSTSSSPFPRVEPCRPTSEQSRDTSACVQSRHQAISPSFFRHGDLSSGSSYNAPTSTYQAPPLINRANSTILPKDFPVVCGPSALRAPLQQSTKTTHQLSEDLCASTDSKRLKRSLEDLEKELLMDDPDMAAGSLFTDVATTSFLSGMATSSAMLNTCNTPGFSELVVEERDWTDAIEDFLSADSSSPTTTIDHSTITSVTSNTSTMIPHSKASTCNPKELLLACADAINNDDFAAAQMNISALEQYVSIYGDPMQRLAAHMAEALATRLELIKNGNSDRPSKIKTQVSPLEILQSTQVLYQWCLHFKFGYLAANAAIAEACRNERNIHIIDFNIGQGNQWQTLIGAFSQRPGGPPHIRITGISDPSSPASTVGVVQRLHEVARRAKVSLEFKHMQMEASLVEPGMLQKKAGEAVAVNLAFHLHKMADESVSTSNPRDSLLRKVKALEPKIVTVVEHDANTNTAPFYPRFVETLDYFNAVFESLDVALPRDSKDRVNAEKFCLARDMTNIVACEGVDRVQRFEVAGKWRARMMMAGFRSLPTSPSTSKLIKDLLLPYSRKYKIREEVGALHLNWLDRSLVVASAWQ